MTDEKRGRNIVETRDGAAYAAGKAVVIWKKSG